MRRIIVIMIVLLVMNISGCASAQKTNSDAVITKDQAVEIIASDLKHHGIHFTQLDVNNLQVDQTGTKAVVECTIVLPNGSTTETIPLIKENGSWFIDGHRH